MARNGLTGAGVAVAAGLVQAAGILPEPHRSVATSIEAGARARAPAPGARLPLDERLDLLTSVGIDVQILSLGPAGPYLPSAGNARALLGLDHA